MQHTPAQADQQVPALRGPVWYPVVLLSTCYLLANIDRSIFSLLVRPIKAAFNMTDAQVGFLQGTAFSMFVLVGALPLSRLADRSNRPKIISICVLVWSIATSACGFATSQLALFGARSIVAIGEGGLPPAALSFFPDIYRGRAIIRANAAFLCAVYLGGGFALLFGGVVYASAQSWHLAGTPFAHLPPWQLVFVVVGSPGLLLGPLVWLTLKEPSNIARMRPKTPYGLFDTLKYMLARPKFQAPFVVSLCASVLLATANLAWIPAMLMRNFKLHERQVGLDFGLVYMVAGLLGALMAGVVGGKVGADGEQALKRVLRMVLVESVLMVVPTVLAPLAPNLAATLIFLAVSIFLYSGVVVLLYSIPPIVYPVGMRAQAGTLTSVLNGLVGGGAGPLLVGLISDAFPPSSRSLASAISIVSAISVPLIALSVLGMQRALRRNPGQALPPPPSLLRRSQLFPWRRGV